MFHCMEFSFCVGQGIIPFGRSNCYRFVLMFWSFIELSAKSWPPEKSVVRILSAFTWGARVNELSREGFRLRNPLQTGLIT